MLIPPGCHFRVESVLPQGDLTIIQLLELPSKEWIMDLNPGGSGLGAAMLPHARSASAITDGGRCASPTSSVTVAYGRAGRLTVPDASVRAPTRPA